MNLKLLLSILCLICFKSVNSGEYAFYNSFYNTTISTTSKSTTSSNRHTTITPTEKSSTYIYKKEYLICDFNDPTKTENICGGTFTNNANGNNVGIYQALKIDSNEITDYSSIYENTTNGLRCNKPFRYNNRDNYFCTKISDLYQCETPDGYSECNLGGFYGIQIGSANILFKINWELNSAIILPSSGNYTLQFYVYYNCYETQAFSTGGCKAISDQLTVFSKSFSTESFSIVNTYKYSYSNSNDKWIENKIDLLLSTNNLYLKFTFERKRENTFASGGFGIDQITLINNNPDPSTATSTSTTSSTTTTTKTSSNSSRLTSSTLTTTTFSKNTMTIDSSTTPFLTTSATTSKITQISTTQTSENLSDNILIFVLVPLVSIILISVVVILLINYKRPRDVSPIKRENQMEKL